MYSNWHGLLPIVQIDTDRNDQHYTNNHHNNPQYTRDDYLQWNCSSHRNCVGQLLVQYLRDVAPNVHLKGQYIANMQFNSHSLV